MTKRETVLELNCLQRNALQFMLKEGVMVQESRNERLTLHLIFRAGYGFVHGNTLRNLKRKGAFKFVGISHERSYYWLSPLAFKALEKTR